MTYDVFGGTLNLAQSIVVLVARIRSVNTAEPCEFFLITTSDYRRVLQVGPYCTLDRQDVIYLFKILCAISSYRRMAGTNTHENYTPWPNGINRH